MSMARKKSQKETVNNKRCHRQLKKQSVEKLEENGEIIEDGRHPARSSCSCPLSRSQSHSVRQQPNNPTTKPSVSMNKLSMKKTSNKSSNSLGHDSDSVPKSCAQLSSVKSSISRKETSSVRIYYKNISMSSNSYNLSPRNVRESVDVTNEDGEQSGHLPGGIQENNNNGQVVGKVVRKMRSPSHRKPKFYKHRDRKSYSKRCQKFSKHTNTDSSSEESESESDEDIGSNWTVEDGVVNGFGVVNIKKKLKKKKKQKSKKGVASMRVSLTKPTVSCGSADGDRLRRKVASEQARIAVEELCRQAMQAVTTNSLDLSPSAVSTRSTSPQSMLQEVKEEVRATLEKCKARNNNMTSNVMVSTEQSDALPSTQVRLGGTYEDMGIPKLKRSASSENYFPFMAPFLRGQEGNIPCVPNPPRVTGQQSGAMQRNLACRVGNRSRSPSTSPPSKRASRPRRVKGKSSKKKSQVGMDISPGVVSKSMSSGAKHTRGSMSRRSNSESTKDRSPTKSGHLLECVGKECLKKHHVKIVYKK